MGIEDLRLTELIELRKNQAIGVFDALEETIVRMNTWNDMASAATVQYMENKIAILTKVQMEIAQINPGPKEDPQSLPRYFDMVHALIAKSILQCKELAEPNPENEESKQQEEYEIKTILTRDEV